MRVLSRYYQISQDWNICATTTTQGIEYYIFPDWSKLATLKIWTDAAGQILFSLSAGNATMPTLASFNRFHKVSLKLFLGSYFMWITQ